MSDYTAIPSTGKLKLKGVNDASISKKKKKKSKPPSDPSASASASTIPPTTTTTSDTIQDKSLVPTSLSSEDEHKDAQTTQTTQTTHPSHHAAAAAISSQETNSHPDDHDPDTNNDETPDNTSHLKTQAEIRHDEQRRKRLLNRVKKEGIKTHKQRVEELNKYLSGLSEHHDMPKIGPG